MNTPETQVKCPRRNSCIEYGHCSDCGVNRLVREASGSVEEMHDETARLILTEWVLYNTDCGLPTDHPLYVARTLNIALDTSPHVIV